MNWENVINTVKPHVVRIETPGNYGTGFLSLYNVDKTWCGIATAAHVLSHADEWQQPIRIRNDASLRFLKADERVIFLDHATDSAVVFFLKGNFQLPESVIPLSPLTHEVSIGTEVGWLGYPTIDPDTLCFFAGTISARQSARKSYLIDGVTINGVSGGPVFHHANSNSVEVIGTAVAYHPNVQQATLPGLSRAQDVSHFHGVIATINSWDEANEKKKEFEEQQRQAATAGTAPTAISTILGSKP